MNPPYILEGSGGPDRCACMEYQTCAVCTSVDRQVFRREYQGSWLTPIAEGAGLRLEINRRLGPMDTKQLQRVLAFIRLGVMAPAPVCKCRDYESCSVCK